jgi:hypothetical protein
VPPADCPGPGWIRLEHDVKHALLARDRVGFRVEGVEVSLNPGQRPGVLAGLLVVHELLVAHAQAEQEPAWVSVGELAMGSRGRRWRVRPEGASLSGRAVRAPGTAVDPDLSGAQVITAGHGRY